MVGPKLDSETEAAIDISLGSCRPRSREATMTPPRVGRAWLNGPPIPHQLEPRLLAARASPPRSFGLRPPGNLLGSISTLPTVPFYQVPVYGQNLVLLQPTPPM